MARAPSLLALMYLPRNIANSTAAPTGLHLSGNYAKLHYGLNMECTLKFKPGPPPYLESNCPINAPPPAPSPPPLPPSPSPFPSPPPSSPPSPPPPPYSPPPRDWMSSPGVVTTVYTGTTGQVLSALSVHPSGDKVYFTDGGSLKELDRLTNTVTVFAGSTDGTTGNVDGTGTNARFNSVWLTTCFAKDGQTMYLFQHTGGLRKIDMATKSVTTINSGNFHADSCAVLHDESSILITRIHYSHIVQAIALPGGGVSTIAGHTSSGDVDGVGENARFSYPKGITLSPDGSKAFLINNRANTALRQIDLASRTVTSISAGAFGSYPSCVAITPEGTTAIVGTGSRKVFAVDIASEVVFHLAGSGANGHADGTGTNAIFGNGGVFRCGITPDGNTIYTLNHDGNKMVRKVT